MAATIRIVVCGCGKRFRIKNPGRNVRFKCKVCGGPIVYQCESKQGHRLRGRGKDIILTDDEMSIGRNPDNTFVVNADTISRYHCKLRVRQSSHEIEDLGSSNGTFVNDEPIKKGERVPLSPGDLVRLGEEVYRYMVPSSQEAVTETNVSVSAQGKRTVPVGVPREKREDNEAELEADDDEGPGIPDELVGKTINGYEVRSVLSQGGMGRVYRAYQVLMDREVVMKTVLPDIGTDPEMVTRFLQEVRLGAKVNHRNVITFYDIGQFEDFYYFTMEYFPGRNLYEHYLNKPAPATKVITIGKQMLAALKVAHAQNIVHRDIKPQNILMNDKGVVKVLDFGLAKAIQTTEYSSLTMSGQIMGTPSFMAPEQVFSPKEVDNRTDLYAVGAVLYFCITGGLPYSGKTAMEIVRKLGKEFPKPSELNRKTPAKLEEVILTAMAAGPAQRFSSAEGFFTALSKVG